MSRAIPAATLGLLAVAGALAGCTVGPRYRTPSLAPVTPSAFAEANLASSSQPPPGRWWRLYDDAALDRYVERALTRNTDLRQAAAALAEARGVLDEARAGRFPSTTVSTSATRSRSSTVTGAAAGAAAGGAAGGGAGGSAGGTGAGGAAGGSAGGGSGAGAGGGAGAATGSTLNPVARTIYSVGFGATYEVDLFGRIRRGVDAARADVEAQAAAQDLARTAVAAETTRAYLGACTAAQQSAVALQSFQLVGSSLGIITRQRDLGAASDYDVANVRALLEQARATLPPLDAQRRASLYALAVLLGDPPEQVPPEAAACTAPPPLVLPVPVGDGAGLLARRPDVRAAERRLARAVYTINVATADLYPTVTLFGSISTSGTRLGDLGRRPNTAFSLGPLLTWDFPNLIAARARVRQSEARAQGALADFDGTVLVALRDLEQALAVYGGDLDRRAALLAARDAAAEANRLSGVRAEGGAISFLDQLTVQRTLVAAQADLAAGEAALAADQVAVFRALGGGWEEAPPIPTTPLPVKAR